MITRDNLKEVINSLDEKDKKRLLNTNKEYTVLELHIFNAGYFVTCKLTNDFNRYKNVSNYGNCILYTSEVIELLTE